MVSHHHQVYRKQSEERAKQILKTGNRDTPLRLPLKVPTIFYLMRNRVKGFDRQLGSEITENEKTVTVNNVPLPSLFQKYCTEREKSGEETVKSRFRPFAKALDKLCNKRKETNNTNN